MADNIVIGKNNVVDGKKQEQVKSKPKRFNINVNSGKDADGNETLFTFSGPEKASLGLIYDAIHRIMMEVISILQRRAEELRPKSENDTTVETASVKDIEVKEDKKVKSK